MVLDERAAVQHAVDLLEDVDLALVVAVDVPTVLDLLAARGAQG